ncbi:MAG: exonuclease domain-containing protein [Candidatus Omnitrophota bacterium]
MSITRDVFKDEVLIFLDLETTGLNVYRDKIIEIGAVKVRGTEVIEKFHRLVNPRMPIPVFITQLTKIKQEDLTDKPFFEDISAEFFSFLDNYTTVCHNASFEKSFLSSVKKEKLSNVFIDSCELATLLYPVLESYKLENLLRVFGIKQEEDHRALIDAEDTFKVWQVMFDNLDGSELKRVQAINEILSRTNLPFKEIFARLKDVLEEKFKSAPAEKRELLFEVQEKRPNVLLNIEDYKDKADRFVLKEIFKKNGRFSEVVNGYEANQSQLLLSVFTSLAFNKNKYLAVEAGPGTNAFSACFLEAVLFSLKNKEKVIIAVKDINDKKEVVEKSIDKACRFFDAKIAIIKNRDSYLCLSKLRKLLENLNNFDDDGKFALAYLVSFRHQTPDGNLDKISSYLLWMNNALKGFKDFLISEDGSCLGNRCPEFKNCCYQKMLRNVRDANVLIVEQNLILSKPELRSICSYLIIDDAENLEDSATYSFGSRISLEDIQRFADNLANEFMIIKKKYLFDYFTTAEKSVLGLRNALESFSGKLCSLLKIDKYARTGIRSESLAEFETKEEFHGVKKASSGLISCFQELIENLFVLSNSLYLDYADKFSMEDYARKAEEKARFFSSFFSISGEEAVRWVEVFNDETRDSFPWKLILSPVEVSGILAKEIFSRLKACVLTGSVLKVEDSFNFFSERVGLNLLKEKNVFLKFVDSPPAFKKDIVFAVPEDFPIYEYKKEKSYLDAVVKEISTKVLAGSGKNLAIFSSVRGMREVCGKIKEILIPRGLMVLCQGIDGSKKFINNQLKNTEQDMLVLGLRNFTDDIEECALSAVFMDKIAFPHPKDPLIASRKRLLINRGKNPFQEYELPLAVISLRQGVNKLIEKKCDFNVIFMLDGRLLKKDFKGFIEKSFPRARII